MFLEQKAFSLLPVFLTPGTLMLAEKSTKGREVGGWVLRGPIIWLPTSHALFDLCSVNSYVIVAIAFTFTSFSAWCTLNKSENKMVQLTSTLCSQEIKSSSYSIRFGTTSEWKGNNNEFGERKPVEKYQAERGCQVSSLLSHHVTSSLWTTPTKSKAWMLIMRKK